MNQKQLEIFLKVAETLNFTKAAEELYLSQTTVTCQIKNLESLLGVKLFERTSRMVRLTPAGKVFYDGAKRLVEQTESLVKDTRTAAEGYTGMLEIGFAAGINSTGLADVLGEFHKKYPGIRLQFFGGFPTELAEGLKQGRYDLVIAPAMAGQKDPHLCSYSLKSFPMVAAFHKDHPFSQKASLTFSDFQGEKFLYVSSGKDELQFSSQFMQRLVQKNILIDVVARTDNIESILFMLDANMGITVIPEYFQDRFRGYSKICTCPIEGDTARTEFMAFWRDEKNNTTLELLIAFMCDALKKRDL